MQAAGASDLVSHSYDNSGNLLSINYPLIGSVGFSDYNDAGFPGRKTDVNGQSEDYTFDGRGRLTSVKHQADANPETVPYNTSGEVAGRVDEDGVTRSLSYDSIYGRLEYLTDGNGDTIHYRYDARGNLKIKDTFDSASSSAPKRREMWSFDHPGYKGLLYRKFLSDGRFYQFGYDDAGNTTSVTDPSQNTTSYQYDPFRRQTLASRPGGTGLITTVQDFDSQGHLTSVTEPGGRTTTYTVDDSGNVLLEVSPERGKTTYVYDAAGRLSKRTDTRGVALSYTYDALSRPLGVTSPAYPWRGIESDLAVSYTYDQGIYGKGHLTTVLDPSGSTSFAYDAKGRAHQKTSTVSGIAYPLTRILSPAGRLTSLVYPSGRTVDYAYDTCACQEKTIRTTFSGTTQTVLDNLAYRPFGGVGQMSFGNGGEVSNLEDLDGKLLRANAGSPMQRDYTYDLVGRLTGVTVSSAPWFNRTFAYDSLGQLTGATGPFGTLGYTYDDSGNRLGESRPPLPTPAAGRSFTYDRSGRLIAVSASGGAPLAEYTYNAQGQRVKKEPARGETKGFIYDFEGNLLCEIDSTGAIGREYLYRGSSRVGFIENGNLHYFHNDTTGNPILVTDVDNMAVWEGIYEPFGNAAVDSQSTVENKLRFQGQYFDEETGFHYNMHRYYDPRTGLYITPDPIGLAGGINLYVYVSNNPINRIDPFGLWSWSSFGSGALNGGAYLIGGVVVGAAVVATLPVSVATAVVTGAAVAGSAALGWYTGQAITGERIEIGPDGFQTRTMIDDERSELIGGLAVDWASMGFSAVGYSTGREFKIGDILRMAPWGNRTGNPCGELPHYHRRIIGPAGSTIPGGGIGWHRPWEQRW